MHVHVYLYIEMHKQYGDVVRTRIAYTTPILSFRFFGSFGIHTNEPMQPVKRIGCLTHHLVVRLDPPFGHCDPPTIVMLGMSSVY